MIALGRPRDGGHTIGVFQFRPLMSIGALKMASDSDETLRKQVSAFSSFVSNVMAILSIAVLVYTLVGFGPSKLVGTVLDYYGKLIHVVAYPIEWAFPIAAAWVKARWDIQVKLMPEWRYLAVAGFCTAGIFLRSIKAISSRIVLGLTMAIGTAFYCTDLFFNWYGGGSDVYYLAPIIYLLFPFMMTEKPWFSLRIPWFTAASEKLQSHYFPIEDGDFQRSRRNALIVFFGTLLFVLTSAGLSLIGL
jgi:hypothetical protein